MSVTIKRGDHEPSSHTVPYQKMSRTIQIRGDQTLEDLHHAIFDAFDRWDEHMYGLLISSSGFTDQAVRDRQQSYPGHQIDPRGVPRNELGAMRNRSPLSHRGFISAKVLEKSRWDSSRRTLRKRKCSTTEQPCNSGKAPPGPRPTALASTPNARGSRAARHLTPRCRVDAARL